MIRRVLAAGLDPSDDDDLQRLRHARRRLGHDEMVLFCTELEAPNLREMVAREQATGGSVRPLGVPPHDARACFDVMTRTLEELAGAGCEVRMHASGGTTPMACAALLACLATSTEAWFFDAGNAERLVVPRRHVVTERFSDVERRIIAALDGPCEVEALVQATGAGLREVQRALARLRDGQVVHVEAGRVVRPTPVSHYYRDHLEPTATH